MSDSATRIHAEVDYERDGRQTGFLRLPYSEHRSAYGWLPCPVVCLKNGDGPRVLVLAGNHGDEFEGQVALAKLARSLEPRLVRGRIVLLPMANYAAARAARRTSPLDGGNLNRSFPGNADGTPTQMIAHYIEEVLLPRHDLLIDLHSGGSSLIYEPSVQAEFEADGTLDRRLRELVEAFGAPFTQVYAQGSESRMSEAAARRKGLLYLTTEVGGGATVDPRALRVAEHGVVRTLRAFGALETLPLGVPQAPATRFVEIRGDEHFVYASEDGLYEPLVELGEDVTPGQPAAAIHFPETPWREPVVERFAAGGVVLCKRTLGRSRRGDCLVHIGEDWSAA